MKTKKKGIYEALPHCREPRMYTYTRIGSSGTMHIQRVTRDHADAGVLSKFHCKHSGKRVTRAGLSSNRIKAIVSRPAGGAD